VILDQKASFSVALPLDNLGGYAAGKLVVDVFPAAIQINLVNGDQKFLFFHASRYFVPRDREMVPGTHEAVDLSTALEDVKAELRGYLAQVERALSRLNPLALQALVAKVENL